MGYDAHGIGFVIDLMWMIVGSVRFRGGTMVVPSQLAAVGDGPRPVRLVEAQGVSSVGLRAKVRTTRCRRRAAARPQDGKLTR